MQINVSRGTSKNANMPDEKKIIPFYTGINDYSAAYLTSELRNNPDTDVDLRIDSGGGYTSSGAGLIWAMADHVGKLNGYIDGDAKSMAAIMLSFADKVIASNFSELMYHKPSYPFFVDVTPEMQATLDKLISEHLKVLKAKLNDTPEAKAFLKAFNNGDDVNLTAKEAKKIGLVDEIVQLKPTAELNKFRADSYNRISAYTIKESKEEIINKKDVKMSEFKTLAEFKELYPDIYSKAVAVGKGDVEASIEEAIKEERKRVSALMKYNDACPELIQAKIKEGGSLDEELMDKIIEAKANKKLAEDIEDDAVPEIETEKVKTKGKEDEMSASASKREIDILKKSGASESDIKEFKTKNEIK